MRNAGEFRLGLVLPPAYHRVLRKRLTEIDMTDCLIAQARAEGMAEALEFTQRAGGRSDRAPVPVDRAFRHGAPAGTGARPVGPAVDVNTLRVLASTRQVRDAVAGRWEDDRSQWTLSIRVGGPTARLSLLALRI
ncbi:MULTISPECIES: hypothetical protein [Pseudomonas]|uniref:hypothetical protein n=1 Tax=Pseudomonas TaxID=286 RepID=UPI00049A6D96|nr:MULTISPECIES: hypothetical protein [Pseudomonas]AHZ78325.1 hypothetical protein DW66_3820 [Pseudomonas putida]